MSRFYVRLCNTLNRFGISGCWRGVHRFYVDQFGDCLYSCCHDCPKTVFMAVILGWEIVPAPPAKPLQVVKETPDA